MMRMYLIPVIVFGFCSASVLPASLVSTDALSYSVDTVESFDAPLAALELNADSILSASGAGIYLITDAGTHLQRVLDSRSGVPRDWIADCYCRKELNSVFAVKHLWRLEGDRRIIAFDRWCHLLLTFDLRTLPSVGCDVWRIGENDNWATQVAIEDGLLFADAYLEDGFRLARMSLDDTKHWKPFFKIPGPIQTRLDAMTIGGNACIPAFNPVDSTVWVAINGYDSLCVIDLDGKVLDVLPLNGPDWIPPSPPRSRIKSTAVYMDWLSRWTPTENFQYVPPGYFILQYRTGWEAMREDSIPLLTTLVWSADRKPVELTVDHRWQLAGVQPDGRIIFGHYEVADDTCRIVLEVTRIVP